jgi:hypothetical protein
MKICEKQDRTITFSDRSGERISDLSDILYTPDVEVVEGVEYGYSDEQDENNEGPGIAIEQSKEPNEEADYGGVPGVTTEITGVKRAPATTGETTEIKGVPMETTVTT